MSGSGGRVVWAGRVISGLVPLAFLMSAFMKLKGSVLGAILLTGYMGGAICVWPGLYLRESRLMALIPLRRA